MNENINQSAPNFARRASRTKHSVQFLEFRGLAVHTSVWSKPKRCTSAYKAAEVKLRMQRVLKPGLASSLPS